MIYPIWFDFGYWSGNPMSLVIVDAEGEIYYPSLLRGTRRPD